MNAILAGGVFKAFGLIFTQVEAKYNSSAAIISWIPSVAIAIASFLSKYYGVHMGYRFGSNYFHFSYVDVWLTRWSGSDQTSVMHAKVARWRHC